MADDTEWTPKQDMSLLCRVCANQHDYLIPIFQGEGLDHDMPTKMDKHLPIKVRESDKLPTQMCYQCASTIIAWSELHTNCLAADKKLKGMLRINEKKMGVVDTADDDAGSDHYEDAYDDGGGGGDDDDEDFEKEIKQLISDAGVELGSKTAKASKRPSRAAATRKRKSEVTITPVKRETKKPKTEPSASKSSTALLKPKEEVVSNEDRRCNDLWSCCSCVAKFPSLEYLHRHIDEKHLDEMSMSNSSPPPFCARCNEPFSCHRTHVDRDEDYDATLGKKTNENSDNSDIFVCFYCDGYYADKTSVAVHIKVTHTRLAYEDEESYACVDCCKLYSRGQDIAKHMRWVHKKIDCEPSEYVVTNIRDITFPCQVCGQIRIGSRYCSSHDPVQKRKSPRMSKVSSDCKTHAVEIDKCHVCIYCQIELDDCYSLWMHIFAIHSEEHFECNLCSRSKRGRKGNVTIITHMRRMHKISIDVDVERRRSLREESSIIIDGVLHFRCSLCPEIYWSFKKLTEHNLLNHTSTAIHTCKQCARIYPTKKKLEYHVKRVHETMPAIKCPHCGRFFSERSNFNRHLSIHTGERKFVCELCGASFNQWSSLYTHRFSHTDTKYNCSLCPKVYNTPKSLGVHMRRHFDTNVYVCDTCGKQFSSRVVWRGHMKIHNTSRDYVCNICNAGFVVKKYLTQHYRVHKGKS